MLADDVQGKPGHSQLKDQALPNSLGTHGLTAPQTHATPLALQTAAHRVRTSVCYRKALHAT